MKDHIFRTYDIRGTVGTDLDISEVYDFGRSLAAYLVDRDSKLKTVVVGMDGRISSPAIYQEISRSLTDSGLDVLFMGICPTPVMYFALAQNMADAGLMITASHNPACDNGIKISLAKESIWGDQIIQLRNWYKNKKSIMSQEKGQVSEIDAKEKYLAWLVNHFKHLRHITMPFVIDCGNGATGAVIPELVKLMDWKNSILLYETIDGTYPHHDADPSVAQNMIDLIEEVKKNNAFCGIAFDGDGDRMGAVTASGALVPGDHLLALFSIQILAKYPGASIVCDIKASGSLLDVIHQHGGIVCMSPTGISYVKREMKDKKAILGGEFSCHFLFNDRYFGYDDGIYSALRLIELLIESQKTFDQLCSIIPRKYPTPEIRIPCSEEKKHQVVHAFQDYFKQRTDAQVNSIDGIRAQMSYGWGNIRVSNTQPVVSIRLESDTPEGLEMVKKDFAHILNTFFDVAVVEQHLQMSNRSDT